jgi:hypothetical protein
MERSNGETTARVRSVETTRPRRIRLSLEETLERMARFAMERKEKLIASVRQGKG